MNEKGEKQITQRQQLSQISCSVVEAHVYAFTL